MANVGWLRNLPALRLRGRGAVAREMADLVYQLVIDAFVGGTMSATRSFAPALLAVFVAVGCGSGAPQTSAPATDSPTPPLTTPPAALETTPPAGGTGSPSPTDNDVPGPPLPDVARIATGETPAGWKELKTSDAACRIAVPADWDTETISGAAIAPNFAGQVMLSNDQLSNWGSWQDYTATAKTVYFGADKLVLVDTEQLFVMAAGPSSADVSVLVGLNRGETVCGALLTLTASGVADLLDSGFQVLYSLASVG